jgi:hypothetical protein
MIITVAKVNAIRVYLFLSITIAQSKKQKKIHHDCTRLCPILEKKQSEIRPYGHLDPLVESMLRCYTYHDCGYA